MGKGHQSDPWMKRRKGSPDRPMSKWVARQANGKWALQTGEKLDKPLGGKHLHIAGKTGQTAESLQMSARHPRGTVGPKIWIKEQCK